MSVPRMEMRTRTVINTQVPVRLGAGPECAIASSPCVSLATRHHQATSRGRGRARDLCHVVAVHGATAWRIVQWFARESGNGQVIFVRAAHPPYLFQQVSR